MKKVFFISLFCLLLLNCGKKSEPVFKSEKQTKNILIS